MVAKNIFKNFKKSHSMVWYAMLSYAMEGMICYEVSMLCYEILLNIPSFTEEFHLFCIFKL